MSQRSKGQREAGLIGAVETLATGVAHLGYGLLRLPLQVLPFQTRTHVHNAIRELSYGFASLPRDFAEIASQGIERWAQEDQVEDVLMAAPSLPSRGVEVGSTPTERDLGATRRVGLITMPIAPPTAPLGGGMQHFGASAPTVSEGLVIAHIEYNPLGSDIDGEYVLISNTADRPIDLTGWTLHDGAMKHTYTFPSLNLAPDASVRLWTKKGVDDSTNLYWQRSSAIWNNSGDTGSLRLPGGDIVSSYTYHGK